MVKKVNSIGNIVHETVTVSNKEEDAEKLIMWG